MKANKDYTAAEEHLRAFVRKERMAQIMELLLQGYINEAGPSKVPGALTTLVSKTLEVSFKIGFGAGIGFTNGLTVEATAAAFNGERHFPDTE